MRRGISPITGIGWEAYDAEIALCASCPKLCRHRCPVAEVEQRETVTPWALMTAAFLADRASLGPEQRRDEWPYHCAGCGACQDACKFHNDVPGAVHAFRAERFAAGAAPTRALSAVERYARNRGNMYEPSVLNRLRDLVSSELLRPDAGTLVIADPTTIVRYPETIRAAARLIDRLELADVAFLVAGDVSGCGQVLYDMGDVEGFRRYAKQFRRAVGVRDRVYTLQPSDTHLLRDVYPKFGIAWDIPTAPFLELLASHRDRLQRVSAPGKRIVIHPSCHLVRRSMERSDRLIETVVGSEPGLAVNSDEDTFCCGGGGGLPLVLPDVAAAVSRHCVERLGIGEEDILVTTCSACRRSLEKVTRTPVQDILVLLAGQS